MHDLKSNFDKFLELTNRHLGDVLTDGNVQRYRHKPKMPDSHIIALSLCQEALGIDSEYYLWKKLQSDYQEHFPDLIHFTRYNSRRKRLAPAIQKLNERMAGAMNMGEDVYIVDSVPVPVCKISRERRLKVCKEHFESAPDKGFSTAARQYYIGYKLHLVTSLRGVYHSMDLSKASVHDIHYLSDIKYSGLNNCTLLADKGYLSSDQQLDLFTSVQIKLQTPRRYNQKDYKPYPVVFRKSRKRVETLFSQLCDQMMLKRNYAKTFRGLQVRMVSKIAATTALQYINHCNGRPLNHIKHALAA